MKNIILLTTIFCLSSCALLSKNEKRNEEYQYYSFNERSKPTIERLDIFMTKVTKFDTFADATKEVKDKYQDQVRPVGSWDFSQKPSQTLKGEILNKAIDLGANYVVMFEKRNCDILDLKRSRFEAIEGFNCYGILYYNLPNIVPDKVEEKKLPRAESRKLKTPEAKVETKLNSTF
ncbi:MAG: hypothetical protein ACJAZX_001112 [Rickettsiales bacterium]|jgi:hypothetical protein